MTAERLLSLSSRDLAIVSVCLCWVFMAVLQPPHEELFADVMEDAIFVAVGLAAFY